MGKSKSMCSGCRNDFYNENNQYGVKDCWSFKTAKTVTRTRVGTWQNPPYKWSPMKILNCYHQEGSSFITKDDVRITRR